MLELKREDDPGYTVRYVKESLRAIPRGGSGYGILRHLTPADLRPRLDAPEPRISFNYLGQFDADLAPFTFAEEEIGPMEDPRSALRHDLELVAAVTGGALQIRASFSPRVTDAAVVDTLLLNLDQALGDLIAHCAGRDTRERTPSDFTMSGLTLDELDELWGEAGAE